MVTQTLRNLRRQGIVIESDRASSSISSSVTPVVPPDDLVPVCYKASLSIIYESNTNFKLMFIENL